jgi:hypothetical protein
MRVSLTHRTASRTESHNRHWIDFEVYRPEVYALVNNRSKSCIHDATQLAPAPAFHEQLNSVLAF